MATAVPDTRAKIDQVLDALAALGIVEVVYSLDGGGDSGEACLSHVVHEDGRQEESLPPMPVGFDNMGNVWDVDTYLNATAAEHPDENWVDNDGGYGTVTFLPKAEDEDRITYELSFRDEEDDDDAYDEIEDDDDETGDEADAERAAAAAIDDDTPLTIEKGVDE